MYFKVIVEKYVKNFLIILFALSFFFVLLDLVSKFSKLPSSSNLQVLYVYYVFLYGIDLFYPLSLVFAFLLTYYNMVKFNELVSFYSLGFEKKDLLKPFISVGVGVFVIFLLFDSGKLAYTKEYADSILHNNKYTTENLFIKNGNKVIYIKKIEPIVNTAKDLRVFFLKGKNIYKIVYASSAKFKNNKWYAKDAKIVIYKPEEILEKQSDIEFLKNFKPKIVANLKTLNSISYLDALTAIRVFKDVRIQKLYSIILFKLLTPLIMIFLIAVTFLKGPIHLRISNVSLYMIKSVFFALFVWGGEFIIFRFAKQGVLPYYVLFLPFIISAVYFCVIYYKEK